jgi:hypothetical protein
MPIHELTQIMNPNSKHGMNRAIKLYEKYATHEQELALNKKHPCTAKNRQEDNKINRINPNRHDKILHEMDLWFRFWQETMDAAIKDLVSDQELVSLAEKLYERSKVVLFEELLPYYPKRPIESQSDDNANDHRQDPRPTKRRRNYLSEQTSAPFDQVQDVDKSASNNVELSDSMRRIYEAMALHEGLYPDSENQFSFQEIVDIAHRI